MNWSPCFRLRHSTAEGEDNAPHGRGQLTVEEALRASEGRYRSLVTNMSELICEIDSRGVYTYVNERYIPVLGYHPAELLGHDSGELMHPDDLSSAQKKFESLKKDHGSSVDIWRFRHRNGSYLSFECRASVYTHPSGEQRTIVAAYDITERLERDTEKFNLRQRLSRAEKVARFGHWEIDLGTGKIKGSDGAREIYGLYGPDLYLSEVRSCVLPEYNAALDEALDDMIHNRNDYDQEFKIRNASERQDR